MKSTYLVVSNGKHIANQIAGSGEKAVQLIAGKRGLDPKYMEAVEMVSSSDLDLELACLRTIRFEAEDKPSVTAMQIAMLPEHRKPEIKVIAVGRAFAVYAGDEYMFCAGDKAAAERYATSLRRN